MCLLIAFETSICILRASVSHGSFESILFIMIYWSLFPYLSCVLDLFSGLIIIYFTISPFEHTIEKLCFNFFDNFTGSILQN